MAELPEEVWRVQVKRYQDKPVEWPAIERGAAHVGRSMPRRLHQSFAFLDRALHPQGPDPEAERHLEGAKRSGRYKPRVPNQLHYQAPDFQ